MVGSRAGLFSVMFGKANRHWTNETEVTLIQGHLQPEPHVIAASAHSDAQAPRTSRIAFSRLNRMPSGYRSHPCVLADCPSALRSTLAEYISYSQAMICFLDGLVDML